MSDPLNFQDAAMVRATRAVQEALFDLSLHLERLDSVGHTDAKRIAKRVVLAYFGPDRTAA